MKLLPRLSRLRAVLAELSGDPHYQARAEQVVGTALLADGLIGIENPLDGRTSRVGILGAVGMTVVGLMFLAVPSFMVTRPYPDGATAEGRVVAAPRTSTSDGTPVCSREVAYIVDGRRYTAVSRSSSSSSCGSVGTAAEVSYRPADPSSGRVVTTGGESLLLWGFRLFGALFALLGLTTFVVRAGCIALGGWLLLRGRRRLREHPVGDTAGLMERLSAAWSGSDAPVASTAAAGATTLDLGAAAGLLRGVGGIGGLAGLAGGLGGPADQPAAVSPPPHHPEPRAVPTDVVVPPAAQTGGAPTTPPGWYADPAKQASARWWDGSAWTGHTRQ